MLELVELGLACTIFVALPAVFLRDEHLVVDVIDHVVRVGRALRSTLAGALLSLACWWRWRGRWCRSRRTMHEFGDVTSDLSIPKIYYWIPVLLGVITSALATLVFIVRWSRAR